MTAIAIMLNLAMSLPAAVVLVVLVAVVHRKCPDTPYGEGRADWRGPSRGRVPYRLQRMAASIATATNSSAR
jgi:hypothetical protein